MKITWLGHSCFLIEGEQTKILMDPYNEPVGYPINQQNVDIVTTSHGHGDHNDTSWVEYDHLIGINDMLEIDDVVINGYGSYHDDVEGELRGDNVIFNFDIDGLKICHLGDLGHMLSDRLIDILGGADVLMIPVGGYYTIDAQLAAAIVRRLKPKLTIAMHYKTDVCNAPIEDASEFMEELKGEYLKDSTIDPTAVSGVVAMDYKH